MFYLLRRHPIPVRAHFDFTLALTFAFPADRLRSLLHPGLSLDEWQGWGFVAIALVQTREMRPEGWPRELGGSFFLTGYRIFVRYRTNEGRNLRGLQILRSDTDRRAMVMLGNLATHYRYSLADVELGWRDDGLDVRVRTSARVADLDVTATIRETDAELPESSPFPDGRTARRFAGPMPFTFSYEKETRSMVRIEGQRSEWHPRLVKAEVRRADFFRGAAFGGVEPRLASAFYVADVPYRWARGQREAVRLGRVRP